METQTTIIKYLGKDENITQFFSESDEFFADRIDVIKKMEAENIPWKDALKLSKVYINAKYKKCKYSPQLYFSVKKYF
jgi:hypothetical protein